MNEQAAIEAATQQAVQLARQHGGVVQAAATICRQQGSTALHPRARRFCNQAADVLDFVAKQPGCSFETDHGMIVLFAHGMLNDPTAAAAFLATAHHLTSLAKVVDTMAKAGRSARAPDWLVTTPHGHVTVDPARLSSEPAFFNDDSQRQYETEKVPDPEMPVDADAAGRAAYRTNKQRGTNPLTVTGGRTAWFAGWDAELAADERGAAPPPSSPAPAPAHVANRATRRAKKKVEPKPK